MHQLRIETWHPYLPSKLGDLGILSRFSNHFGLMLQPNSSITCGADAVWVHGDLQTSPGVQGFVNSARKEPKGDRVYGILSWDTDATPEELVEQCSRLQLANNCFKDGRHGAYISVDTEVGIHNLQKFSAQARDVGVPSLLPVTMTLS